MRKRLLVPLILILLCSLVYATSEVKIVDRTTSGYKVDVSKLGTLYGIVTDGAPAASITSGQKNITTAGTQLPLTATSDPVRSVCIKAKHANTNMIYIGKSTVSSTTGYVLDAGEVVCLDINDLNTVYIDSDTNGEGVSFIALD